MSLISVILDNLGSFAELIQKEGYFAQLIKQFQSEEEEEEKEEEERQAAAAEKELVEAPAELTNGQSASELSPSAAHHVNFTAIDEKPEGRERAESEGEMRRQSSAASEKPQKPDSSKAKLMTSEDSATGEHSPVRNHFLLIEFRNNFVSITLRNLSSTRKQLVCSLCSKETPILACIGGICER